MCQVYSTIHQAYNCHIYSATTLRAFRVFQAPHDASDFFFAHKGLQLEPEACRNSTSMCWSHKHGCPCVMLGLDDLDRGHNVTQEFEDLLLSCCVLVRNGRGGVAIKEARNVGYLPKEVFGADYMASTCCPQKGLSFISNRQRRKEGTFLCVGVGGDRTQKPMPTDRQK